MDQHKIADTTLIEDSSHISGSTETVRSNHTVMDLHNCLPPIGVCDALKINEVSSEIYLKNKNGFYIADFTISWSATSDVAYKKYKKLMKLLDKVECDGPCGEMVDRKEITEYGFCDHHICSKCIAKQELVSGLPYCSACLGQKSYPVVFLRVIYLASKQRFGFDLEINGETSIRAIIERIDEFHQTTVFFSNKSQYRRKDLKPFPPIEDDHPIRLLANPDGSENIHIVVLVPGIKISAKN